VSDANIPILVVRDATRRFGPITALDRASLTVSRGQFLTLLGPSGSGKTTLLRIVAGLEQPSEIAELRIAGLDVRGIPANHRNVATVFQHYGLFPHMSVGENIEYGLLVRKRPAEERRRRAMEALELVRLPDKYGRRVHQLSGGERQRVALARALVTEPDILLLDEPLGALDEKLRREMQVELLRLQRSLGMTFILVTHSQEEALTMSDRIVLLNRGHIVQDGTPRELFERPASRFVAEFMGAENVFSGKVVACDAAAVRISIGETILEGRVLPGSALAVGAEAFLAVRAEHVTLVSDLAASKGENALPCSPRLNIYKGNYHDTELDTPIGVVVSRQWDDTQSRQGKFAVWKASQCVIGPHGPISSAATGPGVTKGGKT
jgi:ABC-type Fe3+/spermidine/putrescine transport system ATPase subunit